MPAFKSADELLKQRDFIFDQIEVIVKSDNFTAEDNTKIEGLKKEAQDLQVRFDALTEISKNRNAAISGIRENQDNEQRQNDKPNTFKTLGEYLVTVHKAGKSQTHDSRLTYFSEDDPKELKDLNESVGSDGGFLVPPEFRNTMLAVLTQNNIVRRNGATVIPMARREINIPVLDQTGTTAGEPHQFGGINVFWQAEASEKNQSEPNFRQVKLVANKLVGYTRASDELLADSAVSLEAFLTGNMGFAGAIAWREDYAFLNGTGVGQPLGILNSAVTTTVARTVQADVTYTDLVNMEAAFYSPSNRGVWVASQSLKAKLMLMRDPANQYIWSSATSIPGIAGAAPSNTLLGRPIIFTLDQLPRTTTTSNGDLLLADFSFYLIGDRQNTTIESTKYDRWRYDQTSWRVVHRVDGQPWLTAPITSVDGTTQVSPFVILGAKTT